MVSDLRVDGKKRVEWIPEEWVDIHPLVEQGCKFKDALAEVFAVKGKEIMPDYILGRFGWD